MIENIKPGLVGEADETVSSSRTAAFFGSGLVAAYGTPAMVALMENATVAALHKYLGPGQTSVGTEVCIKHLAATPVGMHARARATVTAVDGRQVTFQVEAWDDREKIGEGTVTRFVVDEARFNDRLEKKA
ncbi:MAG TPA: thioesterase family protein [Anaerolineae bacterium]